MSEVQARSQAPTSRGRGGGRGGRGGFASRNDGRANNRQANGGKTTAADFADEDDDVGELRKQYGDQVETIKAIFPDWSDADILYALQETDGDVAVTAERISDGTTSQWGEVSKPKKTTKPKTKEAIPPTSLNEAAGTSRPIRGGREGARGGRGARGNERARGGRGRGSSTQSTTNGNRSKENQQLSVPTDEAAGWGNTTTTEDTTANEWGSSDAVKETATTDVKTTSKAAPVPTPDTNTPKAKTWASMLRQSTAVPKGAIKAHESSVSKPAEALEPLPQAEPAPTTLDSTVEEAAAEHVAESEPVSIPAASESQEAPKIVEPEVALPPPEDDLTKVNLEQLPDESHPPATATAASTTADSWDPRQHAQQSTTATPISAAQAQHQPTRPNASGFATSAQKATERPVRVPSYQRRVLEQEEAVRLPGNREVDRAAVQFGAFSLNGNEDDIDGDREEAETRAQPPSDSPVQPRASLPPAAQPAQPAPAAAPEAFPTATTQKPAASLPQPATAATPAAPPTGPAAGLTTQQPFNQQYGRFGQLNAQDQSSFPAKSYDSFGQQPVTTSAAGFDSFPAPTSQAAGQPGTGAFSSAPHDYSSYYTADQQSRGNYNQYYGQGYGQQQGGQNHNEGPTSHQRPFGGYNASQSNDNLSQYPQSAAGQQSRYGASNAATADAHNSGHNTPNPSGSNQQPAQAGQNNGPQSNLHQQQQQQPPAGGFPYNHPYNNSPFYSQYVNYYGAYGQGGYGGGPYGKGGLYGQPHQYGNMSHQAPYEHSSSPATSGFGQSSLGGRGESNAASGIDNFGRAGSSQSGGQSLGNGGFGGAHEVFNRAGSSYQSPAGQGFNGPNAQTSSTNDDLKPYGDNKPSGGPSPSLAAGARPGSATNNGPGQTGLPPPHSGAQAMGGYGGYPSHVQGQGLHSNQSGGSGFGQGHGSYGAGYGNYGGGQGFGNYGNRQGWGSNY